MNDLDPVLVRQLRKAGVESLDQVPDAARFRELVTRLNEHYRRVREDRDLLTRSLDLSTSEMNTLKGRLELDRDRLNQVVVAIDDALSAFQEISQLPSNDEAQDVTEATGLITLAKRRFSAKLSEIFSSQDDQVDSDTTKRVEAIRTSFIRLADRLAGLMHETADSAALRKELEVARTVQQMLMPAEDVFERASLTLAAHTTSAAQCGGDWWTAHELPKGRVLVIIGDVTGHGIGSAIITGAAKAACDLARTMTRGDLTVQAVLKVMNTAIFSAGKQKRLMTCIASILDPEQGKLSIGNAGHNFPFLVRQGSIRALLGEGLPLGSLASTEYPSLEMDLQADDTLLWYTDGVVECENDDNEAFSDKRLRAACLRSINEGPRQIREELTRSLAQFMDGTRLEDDQTLIVGRVHRVGPTTK